MQSVEGHLAEQRLRLLCGDEEGRGGGREDGEGGREGGRDGGWRGGGGGCYHGIQTVKSLLILKPLQNGVYCDSLRADKICWTCTTTARWHTVSLASLHVLPGLKSKTGEMHDNSSTDLYLKKTADKSPLSQLIRPVFKQQP